MSNEAAPDQNQRIRELHEQAVALLGQQQLGAAQQNCLQIVKLEPRHADAHFLLGMVAIEVGRPDNGLEFIDKALEYGTECAEYLAHRGRALALLKRDAEALSAADRALELKPTAALTLDTIGVVCSRAGDHERAARAFRQAVARSPDTPTFQFNLAASLKFIGKFEQAETAYDAAIEASPRFYKAHAALSQLRTQTPERNHISRLEGLVDNCGDNVAAELQLRHALAKEYEDLGDYDRSFEHLSIGNARRRSSLNYTIDRDRELFAAMQGQFASIQSTDSAAGDPSKEPIFVIGMPRTGTTLVERILTSHTAVHSAGELQNFPIVIKRATGSKSADILDTETIERALKLDFALIGEAYIESTRPNTGHTAHFVDKMPLNYLYVGLIHRALPNARIVCLRRHPLDACLSNFRQLFALKFSYYNYAYDLEDTGRYYALFDRLMQHWQRVLPGKVLEVQYESIVVDQEPETRRIVEFCGLDWQDACLAFDRNEAPVATASAVQVRQPLYSHAAGRWKRYEKHLGPLRAVLETEGIAVD